jgi:hypothetical protein
MTVLTLPGKSIRDWENTLITDLGLASCFMDEATRHTQSDPREANLWIDSDMTDKGFAVAEGSSQG